MRARVELIRRQRERRWDWLRKLPGYKAAEAVWLRFVEVRDAGEESSVDQHKRELPAWMVSFLVHVGLLLMLALIPIAQMAATKLQVLDGVFADGGQGAIEFTPMPAGTDVSLEEIELPMSSIVLNTPDLDFNPSAISSSLSARPQDDLGAGLSGLAIQNGLAGRSGSLKGALLGKFGGNGETEAAVNLGLKWLAYNQLPDGGWSLVKPYNDGASNEDRTAATAMALNAFLGAGHSHKSGEYKELVDRGLKFLLRRQDKEGFFAGGEPSHNQMYSQALATITICEAYGLTGDSLLKLPASRAIKFAEWSQGRQKGWRYEPREDSDLSVTGWYMMALMTGKMAGLEPSEKVIRSVSEYLESVSHEYGSEYSYQRPEAPSLSMTAEGLLCRQYLGWPASHPALQRGIEKRLLHNA
ncbi:MAG: terpene cyclase/mutase family protein, partial [Pirellulaceae bacterium]|nr:terpene cyclase/mutase family protein [Pirellulaceae bacterium]